MLSWTQKGHRNSERGCYSLLLPAFWRDGRYRATCTRSQPKTPPVLSPYRRQEAFSRRVVPIAALRLAEAVSYCIYIQPSSTGPASMCHLYSLRQPSTRLLGAQRHSWQQWRKYRIFPTEEGQILRAESNGSVEVLTWGFCPSWARVEQRRPLARSETAADRKAFDTAFRTQRCLVYADGFFIGSGPHETRRWFFFQLPGGRPFAFAGVWTPFGEHHRTCRDSFAILTCPANATVGLVHERMPVMLGEGFHEAWLDKTYSDVDALKLMLRPWSDRLLEGWEVAEDAQSGEEDVNLIRPVGPKLQPPAAQIKKLL